MKSSEQIKTEIKKLQKRQRDIHYSYSHQNHAEIETRITALKWVLRK